MNEAVDNVRSDLNYVRANTLVEQELEVKKRATQLSKSFGAGAAQVSNTVILPLSRRTELLKEAALSVRRVKLKGVTIGTASRISTELYVTALHIVSASGKLLDCTIDGEAVQLIFSVPYLDLAVLRGKSSQQFLHLGSNLLGNSHIYVSGYPESTDTEMGITVDEDANQIVELPGSVCWHDYFQGLALADITGGTLNLSGGAVLRVTDQGVSHMGVITSLISHEVEGGIVKHIINTEPPADAPPGRIDKDPENMQK
ncbi:hypothetical protein WJX73_006227 [Symbiochloris irregularis]|uniref:Uncharacterized protein n=1 Tax=Symbiochloris irregularis TaxID=706552 RepID=A0AAW1PME9_9CHLO